MTAGVVQTGADERPGDSSDERSDSDAGYRQQARYHPAANFWTVQWRETALLLALTLLLTAFTFWRIHRDVT